MKIIERVLERRIRELVGVDAMKFCSRSGRRTTDTLFAVRKMGEEYRDKKREFCMCFL